MKNKLLISIITIVISSISSASGNFKAELKSNFNDQITELKNIFPETNISTDIRVKDTGLAFGGNFKINKDVLEENHKISEINANVRYEKNIKGFDIFAKSNLGLPNLELSKKFKPNLNLEGRIGYTYKDTKFIGFTKNNIHLVDNDADSEHGFKVESKYRFIENAFLEFKFFHNYLDLVKLSLESNSGARFNLGKIPLKINVKNNFFVDILSEPMSEKEGEFIPKKKFKANGDFLNKFNLELEYSKENYYIKTTGIFEMSKTEQEINISEVENLGSEMKSGKKNKYLFGFGAKLEHSYRKIQDLELKLNLLLGAYSDLNSRLNGKIKLGANAIYSKKIRDNLLIKPSIYAEVYADKINYVNGLDSENSNIKFVPEIFLSYDVTKSLKLSSLAKAEVNFKEIKYNSTNFEFKLFLEYNW